MFKPRLQSPFHKARPRDVARLREFTLPFSSVCPWAPGRPVAIYFGFNSDRLVYVGKSVNCLHRVRAHQQGSDRWSEVRFLPLGDRSVLDLVESALIALFQPDENGQHGAYFNETKARLLLHDFGFLPTNRPLRRIKRGSKWPSPHPEDVKVIWDHIDDRSRRLLASVARNGPRPKPSKDLDSMLLKRVALISYNRVGTRPPHVFGRRGRERLVWIDEALAPTIVELSRGSKAGAPGRNTVAPTWPNHKALMRGEPLPGPLYRPPRMRKGPD